MTSYDNNPLIFREIILNTQKPVVFKNFPLNWLCFQGGLELWCKEFDEYSGSETSFEKISKYDAREPQWERKRQTIQMTAKEFLTEYSKDNRYWCGLNYKRKQELPAVCTNGIDFSAFGFPYAADDATFWLSSQGANTPCHYDSYGCNIVVQVFGK